MERSLTFAVKRYLDQSLHSTAVFLAERLVAEHASDDNIGLLAEAYHRSGAGYRAIALLERHATPSQSILSAQNRYLLALCCYEGGRLTDAENALLQSKPAQHVGGGAIVKLNVPNGASGLFLLGRIYRRLHRNDQAIECFKESLHQDPFLWSAFENLCELGCEVPASSFFNVRGPTDRLDENLRPPSTPPSSLDVHSTARSVSSGHSQRRGKKAMSRTFTEQDADRTAMQTAPDQRRALRDSKHSDSSGDLEVMRLLQACGEAYQNLCLYQCADALHHLASLPPRQMQSAWAQQHIGRAHFEMAQYPQAALAFETQRALCPDRLDGISIYSTTLWHLKRDVDLSYLAQQVTDMDKASAEAWCVAGNCFSLQKEHDVALDFFTRAIQVDPTFPYAYTLAGHEYVANEDFDKAMACFRQAIRIDPRHYNAWCGLGTIYFKQEKFQLAEYHFGRAIAINAQSSLLHCFRGVVLHAMSKDDDALLALENALALHPMNVVARYHKANIFALHHRFEEALEELHMVQDAAPKDYTVHFTLGSVYAKLGRTADALGHLNHALVLGPKDCHGDVKAAIEALYESNDD
ncbi:hypothetical protein, variant [Aphanomyces invadans]|uniref:Uncharacterized protein n=1 Tax=Aphanomyces invadans TaxID=157072 RepID=A0A024U5S2_9STRA|nr:hypothetical protein, variant [Aphanomyces invadans]ETW00923.1 hypothetical protein, variant [Aphanomyces invadans]|eukprot:XP_008869921.1 hypothetical protein, variant [Aphanomyces invadans]